MTSTIGIPIKLLNEAQVSKHHCYVQTVVLPKANQSLLSHRAISSLSRSPPARPTVASLLKVLPTPMNSSFPFTPLNWPAMLTNALPPKTAEDNMNVQLKDITVTARDGRVSHLEQVYIRGSHVRFFIVPDMLRYVQTRPPPTHPLRFFSPVALYSISLIGPKLIISSSLFFVPQQKRPHVPLPQRSRPRCRSRPRSCDSQ